jgi:hypothetical protein
MWDKGEARLGASTQSAGDQIITGLHVPLVTVVALPRCVRWGAVVNVSTTVLYVNNVIEV